VADNKIPKSKLSKLMKNVKKLVDYATVAEATTKVKYKASEDSSKLLDYIMSGSFKKDMNKKKAEEEVLLNGQADGSNLMLGEEFMNKMTDGEKVKEFVAYLQDANSPSPQLQDVLHQQEEEEDGVEEKSDLGDEKEEKNNGEEDARTVNPVTRSGSTRGESRPENTAARRLQQIDAAFKYLKVCGCECEGMRLFLLFWFFQLFFSCASNVLLVCPTFTRSVCFSSFLTTPPHVKMFLFFFRRRVLILQEYRCT
jgi:hypothetical protein